MTMIMQEVRGFAAKRDAEAGMPDVSHAVLETGSERYKGADGRERD